MMPRSILYPTLALLAGLVLAIAGTAHAADTVPRTSVEAIGATTDAKCTAGDSICSVVALLKGLYYNGVPTLPTAAAGTVSAKTVTNSSAAFLAASSATTFLLIKNEDTVASIALNFANGSAALNTAGNITLPPGASITFDANFVPTGAITAISSAASSPATVIAK